MEQVNDDDMGRKDQYMLKVVDTRRHCYAISCSDNILGRRHLKGKGLLTEGSMVQSKDQVLGA